MKFFFFLEKKKQKNKNKEKKSDEKTNAPGLLGEIEDQNDSDLKYRSDCKKCPHCDKYILNSNFMMHELHCSKIRVRSGGEQAGAGASATASSKSASLSASSKAEAGAAAAAAVKPVKNDKIKKNPVESAQTDDFDELVGMFQQSNNVCSFKGCKTLVKTLGQNCEFCRHRFCLNHSLAEVRIIQNIWIFIRF